MDQSLLADIDAKFDPYLGELVEFVRRPSVSATNHGIKDCASYLAGRMRAFGIEAKIHELDTGNPVILGHARGRNPDKTLLVYDHYDVQPADPLDEWLREPFSGEVAEGKLHGRGASDSKGNLMAFLSGVRSVRETIGLPLDIKFLFEGGEEIASPGLEAFVNTHLQDLHADAVVVYDSEMDNSGRPMISLGMKGLIYVELRCRKASRDLHSSKAALVPSAAWRLVDALSTLRDEKGRIAIPGWCEGRLEPTAEDIALVEKIPFDEADTKRELGVDEFIDDLHGAEATRNFLYEPTCNIAGLTSGYQGDGMKTVLPGEAKAKLDMRLVFDQSPDRSERLLREHLRNRGFSDVEVKVLGGAQPSHTPVSAPIARAASEAARIVYGADPVIYPKHHASGPDYLFTKNLGLHSIWTGCTPAFGNAHGPNEFIGVKDYELGIKYAAEIVSCFGNIESTGLVQ